MTFLIQTTLVYVIPLLLVALAGMFAERSGIINIALDGMMIFGGFVGAVFAYLCQKLGWFGGQGQWLFLMTMLVAAAAGAVYSLLLSYSAINLQADQTIGGTALNMLAPALVNTFGLAFFSSEKINMPGSLNYALINDGATGILAILTDKAYLSTYLAIVVFVVLSVWVYKTKTGMRLRACGEHPQAADSVGINVYKMRYLGTTISGALAGLGGYIYIATICGGTAEGTVGGSGFLALAIMIFGNWKPVGIALGALMFGILRCLGVLAPQIPFLAQLDLPMYFYNIIPFVTVLVVLALTSKKSGCPKAEGIPYDKGQR